MQNLNYKVIASGSAGNAVRIDNVMIDCGIPFKDMKEELFKCKYLFITHVHGDHLKIPTYKKIRKLFPRIEILTNIQVAKRIEAETGDVVDTIVDDGLQYFLKGWTLTPFEVPHDVLCHGLTLSNNYIDVIYATDSAGTKTWTRGKYDYLFIESNHDEVKLMQVARQKNGYIHFENGKRHTSTQESREFYFLNRKERESEWIELHKSWRFY